MSEVEASARATASAANKTAGVLKTFFGRGRTQNMILHNNDLEINEL